MAAVAIDMVSPVNPPRTGKLPRLCHFTALHTELKSRSYYMQFMPLAAGGTKVRYVSPAGIRGRHHRVDFVALPKRRGWLRHLLAIPSLLNVLRKQRAGLYHFQDLELLPAALLLKLLFRKRVVFDCYEDFPSMALTMRNTPPLLRPVAASIVAAAVRLAAHTFDGLMTADPLTLRKMARSGRCHKITFYNFPNLDVFPPPAADPAKDFDIVYRGGLSERAGTWVLLDAMRLVTLRGLAARLLLIGYCDDAKVEAALRERIRGLGLSAHVELMKRIPHDKMAQTLSRARIGISPLQDIPKFRINIPVKVFEYWACGLPVIASDLPPIRPFFKNVNGGLLFQPAAASALAHSIGWMLEHPEISARMGQNGRDAVVHRFNHHRELQKLRRFFALIAADVH
jgi:glycosyltransferase involved in cell wall biosynthesis